MDPTLIQHIEIRKNRSGQPRAIIVGTRMRVQDIYVQSEVWGKSSEQIVADFPHLTLGQVHAALSYYFDNREAILSELREDKQLAELMRSRSGPGPLEQKLQEMGPQRTGTDDAVSS